MNSDSLEQFLLDVRVMRYVFLHQTDPRFFQKAGELWCQVTDRYKGDSCVDKNIETKL